jgi:hypothetical protein
VSLRAVFHRPDVLRDGEAIPKCSEEIASTGTERRFRNDTKQEIATLQTPWVMECKAGINEEEHDLFIRQPAHACACAEYP